MRHAAKQTLKRKSRALASPSSSSAPSTSSSSSLAAGWHELGDGCTVGYFPGALAALCQQVQPVLLHPEGPVHWQQRSITLFGRPVLQPRLIHYMADSPEQSYTYSGLTLQPSSWLPEVLAVKAAVEELVGQALPGARFNSCLLNLYRNGKDHISWHSDNEPLYGPRPTIASVSFGAARDFHLKRASAAPPQQQPQQQQQRGAGPPHPGGAPPPASCSSASSPQRIHLPLPPGSVVIMAGSTQQHWLHCVPRRAAVAQPRVNLTFRCILPPSDARATW